MKDKTVVVTGGAQGIGMAVSKVFALAGAFVVVADSDAEAGNELMAMFRKEGLAGTSVTADVANVADVEGVMSAATARRVQIDVLINNAGVSGTGGILEGNLEAWHRTLAVNLTGPYLCTLKALPHMREGGAVVNIASTRALMSESNTEPYSASKGGLLALTHAVAISLGPRRIRVNAICPGWIDVSQHAKVSRRKAVILSKRDHEQHPVGRVGVPEDIAEACLFLADGSRSGFMTGQHIVVDGGMTVKMIYEE